jgi:oxygen-independent coproporphyrinogen-3 oxidase
MIFFPGSTFGENEVPTDGIPEITVSVYPDEDGVQIAYVSIKLNDRVCEAIESVRPDEEISIATHSSLAVGRALFAAGKEMLGHIPPWGILTGIRPAKVAASLLYSGKGRVLTKKILRDEHFLNPQKAALAVSVASNEIKILKKLPKNSCSLYISIPFCPTRCAYCSFVSYTTKRLLSMIDDYLKALLYDIDEKIEIIKKLGLKITTVYIGGGTPTTLNESQLKSLLSHISAKVDTASLSEFTVEAGRPDTITCEKLRILKNYGVTRISVNPQTLNNDLLREIGRKHTAEDFYAAYKIALESGIKDINVDLIAGLPGDDFKSFSETLDKVLELKPTNLTVHSFCVKKAAELLKNNSEIYTLSSQEATKSVSYAQLKAKFAGYKPYYMYRQKNTIGNLENVGFSLEGHEGLYNIYMMEDVQTIFGVGAGAVTKLVKSVEEGSKNTKIKRIFNPKYPYEYLNKFNEHITNDNSLEDEFLQISEFYRD